MRTPTPAQLLAVWERGGDQPLAARALLLLGAAVDGADADALAALPLGRRDALLLELRERLFGPEVVGVAECPQCAAAVEATFRCADLHAAHAADAPQPCERTLHADGVRMRFRLPDSTDLLALAAQNDIESARAALLARCVLGVDGDANALSPALANAVAEAMAAADPQADLRLAFRCPQCRHAWDTAFDIARFLWQELHAWSLRTLRDVDALARAYHWREADILALGPRRRQAYLELSAS